jgi:hypothetical protein
MIGMTWDDFRAIRFGLWIKSPTTLRDYAEKIGMPLRHLGTHGSCSLAHPTGVLTQCEPTKAINRTTLLPFAQPAREKFKLTHQPLEAALFFIALGKKSMLLALCKSIQDTKLSTFFAYAPGQHWSWVQCMLLTSKSSFYFIFCGAHHLGLAKRRSNDFSEERWQTAASKNAYVLMGRQQFMQVRRAYKHRRPTLSPRGWV